MRSDYKPGKCSREKKVAKTTVTHQEDRLSNRHSERLTLKLTQNAHFWFTRVSTVFMYLFNFVNYLSLSHDHNGEAAHAGQLTRTVLFSLSSDSFRYF